MAFGGFAPLPLRLGGKPREGWSAQQHARLSADLAAVVRTVPFAVITVNQSADTAGAVESYIAQHGVGLAAAPTPVFVSAGVFTLTWTGSYSDDFLVAQGARIVSGAGTCHATSALFATVDIEAPNVVRVRTFSDAGAATNTRTSIAVY